MSEWDAIVVGAGPNGLTAAARLATNGRRVLVLEGAPTIGGGSRTAELLSPGIRHDICAAVHPSGAGSEAFAALRLEEHGLEWCHPPLPLAHPLDGDEAAVLDTSVERTAASFGAHDGERYTKWVQPLLDRWEDVRDTAMGPIVRFPSSIPAATRFALAGIPPASLATRRFRDEPAKALIAGLSAHSCLPLDRPFTTGVGLTLGLFAHVVGWPVAKGGSQSVVDALAAVVRANGGTIETDHSVASLRALPDAKAVLLDITPRQLLALADGRLDGRAGRAYRRFRYGVTVVKIDYVLSGPVPWRSPDARRAGTVHLGGHFAEIAAAEAQMDSGRFPERPYVLVAQPAVADPSRGGRRPPTAVGVLPSPARAATSPWPGNGWKPRSTGGLRAGAISSSRPRPARDPNSRPTTRTTSRATSRPVRCRCGSSSPGPGWPSTRTGRHSTGCGCARPRPHPAPVSTAWPVGTPPDGCSRSAVEGAADQVVQLIDLDLAADPQLHGAVGADDHEVGEAVHEP